MLDARGVDLVRGGCPALAGGVDLSVSPGEFVPLCGPNGAGKSSLLAVLSGELRPDAGAVLIDDRPVAAFPAAALAAERAVLEQAPTLAAPFTVAALLGLGHACLDPVRIDEGSLIDRALAATGLAGYATRPADRLSGGEQARVHLARVLVQLWAGRREGGGASFSSTSRRRASICRISSWSCGRPGPRGRPGQVLSPCCTILPSPRISPTAWS